MKHPETKSRFYKHESRLKFFHFFRMMMVGLISTVCFCSIDQMAGNSSQTGNNGIMVLSKAGQITGKSDHDLSISVYKDNYLPHNVASGFCDSTVSDDSGYFAFNSIPSGYYNLFAYERVGSKSVFIKRIAVFTDSSSLLNDSLRKPGFLTGISTDKSGNNLVLSYVFIKGSPFYTVTNNSGKFLLGPLPPNGYTISFYANFKDAGNGALSPVLDTIKDTGMAVVYPDSISNWNW
jgi:hypothetical protein